MNGGPEWSVTDFVLADLYDMVSMHAWLTANHGAKERDRSKRPELYPRPGLETKRKISAADLAAFRERTRKG